MSPQQSSPLSSQLASPMAAAEAEARISLAHPLDLVGTLAPLAHGRHDPTIRFTAGGIWRAMRTSDGSASLHVAASSSGVIVRAWGPGAAAAIEMAPGLIGLLDEPDRLVPRDPILRDLVRRNPGLRLPRSRRLFEALVPAILEQKVTGVEARRSFRALIARHGEAAPGPAGLRLQPSAEILAALPYPAYHVVGVERRRADLIRSAARMAPRFERAAGPEEAGRMLRAIAGIGPWTTAEVLRVAWGDPDAFSLGDYHLPNLVAWAFAGEARADEARMLELLEPYRGQRGRVQRLLEASSLRIPRFGPRMAARSIARI
jgi:3-methyladenine DNA glycosylase/8-oxoguanine DNA glycosylase